MPDERDKIAPWALRDDFSSHIPLGKFPMIPEHIIDKARQQNEFCPRSRDHIHCDCYHGRYQLGQETGEIGTCCLCGESREPDVSAPIPAAGSGRRGRIVV